MIVDVHSPATAWETVATTRWGQYTTEVVEEAIRRGADMAAPARSAIEIGCEGGRWSRLLASLGWTMTCTDVDPTVLSVCQQRVPAAKCILVSPNDPTLPCASHTMNLMLCLEVFPVMDSTWFLPEASRVLTDDGVLVGVMLNKRSLRGMFVRVKQSLAPSFEAFYQLSHSEWRRRMNAAGFEIAFERGYCWFPLSRESNSVLAPYFGQLERRLGLGRMTAFSPWVIFIARKRPATNVR